MGDNNKDTKQGKCIEDLFPDIPGCSEEDLLDEYEAACNLDIPLLNAEASSEEFEKIWSRIQAERADSADKADSQEPSESDESGHGKIIRVRFSWKRLAAVGVIACLLAGSGCMVAMGTKSYFYRERVRNNSENDIVFNNDSNKVAANGEEDAYEAVESELGIKSLKMGYIPNDMQFEEYFLKEGIAYIRFVYKGQNLYLVQSKYNSTVSFNYNSDLKGSYTLHNKWLSLDIHIQEEKLENNTTSYEMSFISNGGYYRLSGVIEKEEFEKIVERLTY